MNDTFEQFLLIESDDYEFHTTPKKSHTLIELSVNGDFKGSIEFEIIDIDLYDAEDYEELEADYESLKKQLGHTPKVFIVTEVHVPNNKDRRKGFGTALYQEMLRYIAKEKGVLVRSYSVSDDAMGIWNSEEFSKSVIRKGNFVIPAVTNESVNDSKPVYIRPHHDLPDYEDKSYIIHVTSEKNLSRIRKEGLKPIPPPSDYSGSGKRSWLDSETEPRVFFGSDIYYTAIHSPKSGGVILRVPSGVAEDKAGVELWTTKPVPASKIEVLTTDGWKPITESFNEALAEPKPASGTVRLYRGDAKDVKSFSINKASPMSLFGSGIYLTSSKRIARDYFAKGGGNEGTIIFRMGGRKTTKEEAITRYIRRNLAPYVDENGDKISTFGGEPLPAITWDPTYEPRLAYARKEWERVKKNYDVRKLVDGDIVIMKKGSGSLSMYDVPQTVISTTLDAEKEISNDLVKALSDALNSVGDSKTADDMRQFVKGSENDGDSGGYRPSFREVYTSITAGSSLMTARGQQVLRKELKAIGYSGIRYQGGVSMGGGTKHEAYVFWNEQGFEKKYKVGIKTNESTKNTSVMHEGKTIGSDDKFWINVRTGKVFEFHETHGEFVERNYELFGIKELPEKDFDIDDDDIDDNYADELETEYTQKLTYSVIDDGDWVRVELYSLNKEINVEGLKVSDIRKALRFIEKDGIDTAGYNKIVYDAKSDGKSDTVIGEIAMDRFIRGIEAKTKLGKMRESAMNFGNFKTTMTENNLKQCLASGTESSLKKAQKPAEEKMKRFL